jgi:hypothetical protein
MIIHVLMTQRMSWQRELAKTSSKIAKIDVDGESDLCQHLTSSASPTHCQSLEGKYNNSDGGGRTGSGQQVQVTRLAYFLSFS